MSKEIFKGRVKKALVITGKTFSLVSWILCALVAFLYYYGLWLPKDKEEAIWFLAVAIFVKVMELEL